MNAYIRPRWRDDIDQLSTEERGGKLQSLFLEDWGNLLDKIADYSDSHGENMSPEEIRAAAAEALKDNKQRAMPHWAEFHTRNEALSEAEEEREGAAERLWLDQRQARASGRRHCRRKLPSLIRKAGLTTGVERLIGEVEWSDRGILGLTADCNKALLELPRTPAVLRLLSKHGLIKRTAEQVWTQEELAIEQEAIDAIAAGLVEIQDTKRHR